MTNNIQVEITIKDNEGAIDYTNSTFPTYNNISDISLLSERTNGQKPFLLGTSKFSDDCKVYEKYNGYISRASSDNSGDSLFTMKIKFSNAQGSNGIGIYFDPLIGEYATSIMVNSTLKSNDDYFFYFPTDNTTASQEYTIKFLSWSKPNKPIVINAIVNDIIDTFNSPLIKDLVIGQQIASDNTKPSFGLIGKYGNLNIVDKNEVLNAYLKEGLLKNNNPLINIKYNNNYIGRYYSRNWQQEESSKTFSLELYDSTENYDNIQVPKITYQVNKTAFQLFELLFGYTKLLAYKMDSSTKTRMQNITIKHFYTKENKSLYSLLNNLCNLAMVSMFINENNELEVIDYV